MSGEHKTSQLAPDDAPTFFERFVEWATAEEDEDPSYDRTAGDPIPEEEA